MDLLVSVYGVQDIAGFIRYEDQVMLDHTSFIDGYIPSTRVMIEQKSLGSLRLLGQAQHRERVRRRTDADVSGAYRTGCCTGEVHSGIRYALKRHLCAVSKSGHSAECRTFQIIHLNGRLL